MKAVIRSVIDRTVKHRTGVSFSLYLLAKHVVSAFENHDVVMETNGELWLLGRVAARGSVIAMDIGANRGEWVSGLLEVAPIAQIFCYEPVPTTFAALASNVSNPNVELINKGMSSEPGELIINSVIDNPYISSVYDVNFYQEGHDIESIAVPTSTGDAEMALYDLSHIDIAKVDAEGHDLAVIEGFRAAIEAGSVDLFQFEYNQFTLAARCALRDFFMLLGPQYLLCRLLPNGLEACGYHADLDNFGQSNWVAVRRKMLDAATIHHFSIRPAGGVAGRALAKSLSSETDLAKLLGVTAA